MRLARRSLASNETELSWPAIVAKELGWRMSTKAGMKFLDADGNLRRADVAVDFEALVGKDTVISNPPKIPSEATGAIGLINNTIDISATLLGKRGP